MVAFRKRNILIALICLFMMGCVKSVVPDNSIINDMCGVWKIDTAFQNGKELENFEYDNRLVFIRKNDYSVPWAVSDYRDVNYENYSYEKNGDEWKIYFQDNLIDTIRIIQTNDTYFIKIIKDDIEYWLYPKHALGGFGCD